MNWERTDLKRSYICNRDILKFFRERKDWSQQKLAEETGLSVRVVSKAEAGHAISTASIAAIAAELSVESGLVFPEDLISFPLELIKQFIDALYTHKEKMMDVVEHLIDPDAVFRVTGDPKRIPFAGVHKGCRAFRRSLKKFSQILENPADFDHESAFQYFSKGNDVVVWGTSLVRLVDSEAEPEPMEHRQRLRFRRGLLYSYEDHYDFEMGKRVVENAAEVLGDKIYDPLEDSRSSIY